jgi:hypothetical protein
VATTVTFIAVVFGGGGGVIHIVVVVVVFDFSIRGAGVWLSNNFDEK